MPVVNKEQHEKLIQQLNDRVFTLTEMVRSRSLTSSSEGLRSGSYAHPERMCATLGSASEIRVAIADFKTILAELGRIK